ncbi:hypothetical protein [Dictyobacter formicarum]|uniref:hypothetical protein n=1 Tax=Dictyobacter formicarum TaxID=2778368 RepID=UPI001915816D|nr:hypothetical protein [Dictyobacter formicarum]
MTAPNPGREKDDRTNPRLLESRGACSAGRGRGTGKDGYPGGALECAALSGSVVRECGGEQERGVVGLRDPGKGVLVVGVGRILVGVTDGEQIEFGVNAAHGEPGGGQTGVSGWQQRSGDKEIARCLELRLEGDDGPLDLACGAWQTEPNTFLSSHSGACDRDSRRPLHLLPPA